MTRKLRLPWFGATIIFMQFLSFHLTQFIFWIRVSISLQKNPTLSFNRIISQSEKLFKTFWMILNKKFRFYSHIFKHHITRTPLLFTDGIFNHHQFKRVKNEKKDLKSFIIPQKYLWWCGITWVAEQTQKKDEKRHEKRFNARWRRAAREKNWNEARNMCREKLSLSSTKFSIQSLKGFFHIQDSSSKVWRRMTKM